MKYYLGGPMTGIPEHNFPLFEKIVKELRGRGWGLDIVSAHEVDYGETVETRGKTKPYVDYIRGDLRVMLDCDAVIFLPGWDKSRGCKIELNLATALHMNVYTYVPPQPGYRDHSYLREEFLWNQTNMKIEGGI